MDKKALENQIIQVIKTVYDPEIPVDIFELGLIYEIHIEENYDVKVIMTLTSPSCPSAEEIPGEVERKIRGMQGINDVKVEITFDPAWDKDMMSEEAKLELGFM